MLKKLQSPSGFRTSTRKRWIWGKRNRATFLGLQPGHLHSCPVSNLVFQGQTTTFFFTQTPSLGKQDQPESSEIWKELQLELLFFLSKCWLRWYRHLIRKSSFWTCQTGPNPEHTGGITAPVWPWNVHQEELELEKETGIHFLACYLDFFNATLAESFHLRPNVIVSPAIVYDVVLLYHTVEIQL